MLDYLKENESEEIYKQQLENITRSYNNIINDISYFRCLKRTGIWAFSRNEIYKVFQLVAKLCKLNGDNPIERPLKGVLMTSISNYILKSRNNYNEDYICKYLSKEVAELSIDNHEIWMQKIENLNDEREQKIISELFEEEGWKAHLWAKDIIFEAKRNYYVSCFCKSLNDENMQQNYGSCLYGYKDDRMADILAPIHTLEDENKKPFFSQVVVFDVLYDSEEAKEEMNFLCSIIENFEMNENNKRNFLEEILQYWILSVKDKKWAHERERRYVLFMYENYEYKEVDISDERFLKLKTSLFIQPDFILGNNPVKNYLRATIDNKRHAISRRPYLFCSDCFNRDFDSVVTGISEVEECMICGSKNISYETPVYKQ